MRLLLGLVLCTVILVASGREADKAWAESGRDAPNPYAYAERGLLGENPLPKPRSGFFAESGGPRSALAPGHAALTAPVSTESLKPGTLRAIPLYGKLRAENAAGSPLPARPGPKLRPFSLLESRVLAPAAGKGVGS